MCGPTGKSSLKFTVLFGIKVLKRASETLYLRVLFSGTVFSVNSNSAQINNSVCFGIIKLCFLLSWLTMQTVAHPYSCFYFIAIGALLFRDKSFLLPISCCERNVSHLWKKLAYLELLLGFACLPVFQVFLCLYNGKEQIKVFQLFLLIKIDLDVPWPWRKGNGRMKKTRFLWIKVENEGGGMQRVAERVHEPKPAVGSISRHIAWATQVAMAMAAGPRDECSSHCPALPWTAAARWVLETPQTLFWQNTFVPWGEDHKKLLLAFQSRCTFSKALQSWVFLSGSWWRAVGLRR